MILDGVVGAAFEDLGDLGPLVAHNAMHEEEDPFLLFVPVDLLDARVEVVVPALATLLAYATVQVLRNEGPLLRAVGDDELKYTPVFLRGPCAFNVERFAFLLHLFHRQKRVVSFGLHSGTFCQLLALVSCV